MSDEQHILPITYKGEELEFPLQIVPMGFTYKFIVTVGDAKLIYEKDDEGEYRAMLADPNVFTGKMPDRELLIAINEVLQSLG